MSKLIAIHSGDDWAYVSADYVVAPDDLDIDKALADYNRWKRTTYTGPIEGRPKYLSFDEWLLVHRGCRLTKDSEIEVIYVP